MGSTAYTCQRCMNRMLTMARQAVRSSSSCGSRKASSLSSAKAAYNIPNSNRQSNYAQQRPPIRQSITTSTQTQKPQDTITTGTGGNDDYYVTSLGHSSSDTSRVLLQPNNLFHSFNKSPAAGMRKRAAFIKQHAYCPHPSHQRTRQPASPNDPENRKPASAAAASAPAHVRFECPDCGIPVSCSEEHWQDDFETHLEVCDTLRQINEDDHDLHSGRFFPEFNYPGPQRAEEFVINMSNWDTFLYTRDFPALNESRSMRHVTRQLTYPLTMTSVLHELSPYSLRNGRLTPEGLRSMSALRYTMHTPRVRSGDQVKLLRVSPPPMRLFVLGARAESSLPRSAWQQLVHCFPPFCKFHIIFIGPEAMANRDDEFPLPARTPANPFGGIVEDRISPSMKITTYVDYFQTMHEAQQFYPYDPYFDAFFLFHPGLGHPVTMHEWAPVLPMLLETKCPIICTGFTEWDMLRDLDFVQKSVGGEMDILLTPGENLFRSLRWDLNDLDPTDVYCANWGVWAFRGKRYEATHMLRDEASNIS